MSSSLRGTAMGSNRGKNSSSPVSAARFNDRRQARMRGAGQHKIVERRYDFLQPTSSRNQVSGERNDEQSMAMSLLSSSSLSTPNRTNHQGGDVTSTPAMSVRSGRDVPSSSPSKNIDPRLLADQSHFSTSLMMLPPTSLPRRSTARPFGRENGDITPSGGPRLIGKTIEERKQERMRGAGNYKIMPTAVDFEDATAASIRRRISDAPSSESDSVIWKSPGSLDHFMQHLERRGQTAGPTDGEGAAATSSNWLHQRRMERLRGAGTYGIQRREIDFGTTRGAQDASTSTLFSEAILEDGDDQPDEAGITTRSLPLPYESTPRDRQTSGMVNDSFGRDDYGQDDFVDEVMGFESGSQAGYERASSVGTANQSPGSMAAQRHMEKRKSRRQASPLRSVRKQKPGRLPPKKRSAARRPIDMAAWEEGDETVVGVADVTLQEQRDAGHPSTTLPQAIVTPTWTFPKKAVTKEELAEMKSQVKEMVTLALGKEAAAVRTIRVNDADVLWSVIKREMQRVCQDQPPAIRRAFDSISESLLSTFTHLSRQSAERAQLINHLLITRRRNLQLRKDVFRKRSQVLQVARSLQTLTQQELRRVEREENEERSAAFLSRLRQVSHEWC